MGPPPGSPSEEDGFTMDFPFEVVKNNLEQNVEAMARQSCLGQFGVARVLYRDAIEKHQDIFPVYAEYLRLLYDQGDFETLSKATPISMPSAWNSLEEGLVAICCGFGTLMSRECSDAEFEDICEQARNVDLIVGELTPKNYDEVRVRVHESRPSSYPAKCILGDGSNLLTRDQ
jgi:hypothetical protein